MKLEHLNLVVKNIKRSLLFYQAAFPHWSVRSKGKSLWYGVDRHWVHFGDNYQYLTFNDNGHGVNRDLKSNSIGLAHFAFVTNNIKAVEIRLDKAGYQVAKRGPFNHHRENIYYIDPDGFEVEFVQYKSDIPDERNNCLED